MLSLRDLDLAVKTVFLRVDFNVPLDETGRIRDDSRIQAALPTLRHLLEHKAKVIAASHLGRPKGKFVPELSLKPVAERLSRLVAADVIFAPDAVGEEVERLKQEIREGQVLLLENLRFHRQEKENDSGFAEQLAQGVHTYVNDAFGTCHRSHASVVAITQFVEKSAPGFLVSRELEYLKKAIVAPEKPYAAILGGAKVSDKIPVIQNLLKKADDILIGGAMAYTFFAAQGRGVGRSLIEEDKKELALDLSNQAEECGVNLFLPSDHLTAESMQPDAHPQLVTAFPIPENLMALDIGPETIKMYSKVIAAAKTIFWNGPMGVFEIDPFSQGTMRIAQAVADSGALSIVGGGDSVAALNKAGVQERISHISTGGGASLEFIANETLPGIEALSEQ